MSRIIYLCPADEKPTGGVKVIYRHAELLAALDADAYVLHPFDFEFTCRWFSHRARMRRRLELDSQVDFVIIPELWAGVFGPQCIEQGVRYAIFVQNGYLAHPVLPQHSPELFAQVYRCADLVLSISDDSSRMTALSYPQMDPARLLRVRYSVPECFRAPPGAERTRSITYMPRKLGYHARLVAFALRQHLPEAWEIVPIDGMDEAAVARTLAASRIFLSFSEFEGLPLPPLEAALAGNLVIGYTGQGAREYWDAPNFQEIHQGDIQTFVGAAVAAARRFDAGEMRAEHLAPVIASLADRFSLASESANLQALLGRIDRCFLEPPASALPTIQAAAA